MGKLVIVIGATLLVALCYLLIGFVNLSILPIAGIGLTLFSYWLWQLRQTENHSTAELFISAFTAFSGICFGGLGRLGLTYGSSENLEQLSFASLVGFDLTALLLSLLTSSVVILIKKRQASEKCHRCQNPLDADRILCLRGGEHWVCRLCWLPERFRCKDCEEFRTPLLQLETEDWWAQRLGNRVTNGQCYVCRRAAGERDLRKCRRCTGAMCLRCWDMENGLCAKCGWVIPGLPEPIQRFHAEYSIFEDD